MTTTESSERARRLACTRCDGTGWRPGPMGVIGCNHDAFEAAVSAWGETLHCEAITKHGGQCQRAAMWRLNLHGCEVALLCGHHLRAWERTACATMAPRCDRCSRTFATLGDGYKVTPL